MSSVSPRAITATSLSYQPKPNQFQKSSGGEPRAKVGQASGAAGRGQGRRQKERTKEKKVEKQFKF